MQAGDIDIVRLWYIWHKHRPYMHLCQLTINKLSPLVKPKKKKRKKERKVRYIHNCVYQLSGWRDMQSTDQNSY